MAGLLLMRGGSPEPACAGALAAGTTAGAGAAGTAAGAGAAGAGAAAATGLLGAGCAAGATVGTAAESRLPMDPPTRTTVPTGCRCSTSTPAAGAGSVTVTLSVSSSASGSSILTASPGCLSHFAIVASAIDSPSGGITSSSLLCDMFDAYLCSYPSYSRGLGRPLTAPFVLFPSLRCRPRSAPASQLDEVCHRRWLPTAWPRHPLH